MFDTPEGYLRKGRKKPESDAVEKDSARKIALLDEVHAKQFLYKLVKTHSQTTGTK